MNDMTLSSSQTRFRSANLTPASFDAERRTFDIVWTTGARVQRYSYNEGEVDEELEVSSQAIDLRRLNLGAPVLNSHRSGNLADVIGVIVPGSAQIVSGQGMATVQLSEREDVAPILRDLQSGVLRNFSVGYRVNEYQIIRRDGERPLYRAVKWEPMEVSLVAIPFDAEAQVRGMAGQSPGFHGETSMTTQTTQTTAAPSAPAAISDPVAAERARMAEILTFGERHGMIAEARSAIQGGDSVEQFRHLVLERMSAQTDAASGLSFVNPMASDRIIGRHLLQDQLAGLVDPRHEVRGVRASSFEALAVEYCRQHGLSAFSGAEAVRQYHSSSDFALATANVLGNMVARQIPQMEPAITRAARRIARPNYHTGNMIGFSAASPLQNVNEAGELRGVTVDERGEAMPVPRDLGAVFNITERALRQDVSGVFGQLADAMLRATMEKLRTDTLLPLLANSGNGQTMRDGQPMFHSSHNNRAASGAALSVATLSTARQGLRLQVDSQGARLAVEPWALLVHPAQETVAQQLLADLAASQVSNVNPFSGKLELIVEPGLTSTTGWYLIGDPAAYEGLTVATLEGLEGPSIQTRPAWNTLGLEMRLVWALDARFVETATWYFNPGA